MTPSAGRARSRDSPLALWVETMLQSVRSCLPVVVMAVCAACSDMRERMDRVVVTALPKEVAACKSRGPVSTYGPSLGKDGVLDQLRQQAVEVDANTVFVNSYSVSTTGVAYACDPPLDPEAHPSRRPLPPKASDEAAPTAPVAPTP